MKLWNKKLAVSLSLVVVTMSAPVQANNLFCNYSGFTDGECGRQLGCIISEETTGFICEYNRPIFRKYWSDTSAYMNPIALDAVKKIQQPVENAVEQPVQSASGTSISGIDGSSVGSSVGSFNGAMDGGFFGSGPAAAGGGYLIGNGSDYSGSSFGLGANLDFGMGGGRSDRMHPHSSMMLK